MKNLLVCMQPSYQHLFMKVSWASLCHSTFCWKRKVKGCWHFPVPCLPLPRGGLLDQNKLKKVLWTLSVFNLRPLTRSDSFLIAFLIYKKSIHSKMKKKLSFSCTLHDLINSSPHIFHPAVNIFVLILLSHPLSVTQSYPVFFCVFLSFPRCERSFLDCPHRPLRLSVLQRIPLVVMVTTRVEKTSLNLNKKRCSLQAELCGRTALFSNIHMW